MTFTARPLHEDASIETVTLALNYVCNSRCRFCFIEREIGMGLEGMSVETIAKVFAENKKKRRYKRLILAGAEATLRKDLPDIANRALKEGGFEIVRLQTNGRRLSDEKYLWKLLAAGISEYFVSCHAGTAELDAYLTRNPRSFAEMRQGLRNLVRVGGTLITNSVVTRANVDHLGELADFLLEERVPESHFWAFIEFGDVGQGEDHVAYAESVPKLRAAIARLRAAGRRVTLSWFPECLLGDDRALQKNHRDDTLIVDEFSTRAQRHGSFACPHQAACPRFGKTCFGLHERHVATIGDERDALAPLPE